MLTHSMKQDDPYLRVVHPQVVSSGGLGPCIGVGIYCEALNEGYLCHYSSPSDDLDAMCIKARIFFSGQDVRVVAAGGTGDDGDREILEDVLGEDTGDLSDILDAHRDYVRNTICKYFPGVDPKFSMPNTTSEIIIDTIRRDMLRIETPD